MRYRRRGRGPSTENFVLCLCSANSFITFFPNWLRMLVMRIDPPKIKKNKIDTWIEIAPPRRWRLVTNGRFESPNVGSPKRLLYFRRLIFSLYGQHMKQSSKTHSAMEQFQVLPVKMPKPKKLKPKLPVRRKLVAVGDMFSGQRALLS
jgi:hypothetical protein